MKTTNAKKPNKLISIFKRKNDWKTILFIVCLLAFPLIQWGVFWLYPNIRTFIMPFYKWDYFEAKYVYVGFDNFREQIQQFASIGVNGERSLIYNGFLNPLHSLAINLIILPIALVIGYAFSKHVPGEKFYRLIFFTPSIISTVVLCLIFKFMFEGNAALFIGPVTKMLHAMGINFNGWDLNEPRQMWTLIYIYCIWTGLSINVVLISSAFQRIPKEIMEQARLDGVSFFGEFFKISIPLIMPTISTFLINSVVAITGFYLVPYLLLEDWGPNGMYTTVPWLVFQITQEATQESIIKVSTVGIMFSVLVFPFILLARYIGEKITPDIEF